MADLPEGWGESGWGGRTRKDGYRRNPATRFIAEGDADDGLFGTSTVRDTADEVRVALGLDNKKAEFDVDSPPAGIQGPSTDDGQQRRLDSLDIFRGITIALMIFVDDLGETWPEIHHVPWNGLHLADIVMPFFLWMTGFSIPIALGRQLDRQATSAQITRKIMVRTAKLFVLGVVISGGGLPDGDCVEQPSTVVRVCVGFNLRDIRISGILQRIAVCYCIVATVTLASMVKVQPVLRRIERGLTEYWSYEERAKHVSNEDRLRSLLGNRELGVSYGVGMSTETGEPEPSFAAQVCHVFRYLRTYILGWILTAGCIVSYLAFTLLTRVSNYINPNPYPGAPGPETVLCGEFRTGLNIKPDCNAAGFWDRLILRPQHMFRDPTYRNLAECRVVPLSARPAWCSYPFEAEGIVSTMSSVVTVILGCYFAQILLTMQASGASPAEKMWQWLPMSFVFVALGLLFHFTDSIPLNKNLWSISYLLLTAGIAGVLYALLHLTTDRPVPKDDEASGRDDTTSSRTPLLAKILMPFKWMGGNAIFFFVAHELYERILIIVYNGALDQNLFAAHERLFARALSPTLLTRA